MHAYFFADIDKGGWHGQSWTETIFVLDLSILDSVGEMVTVTERKVLLWGLQRLGAKIDEDDSFDHILNPRSDHILVISYGVIFSHH